MERKQFDALARRLATSRSRRSIVQVLVGAALFGTSVDALADRGKKRNTRAKRGGRKNLRTQAVPASCFGRGTCVPKSGANLAKCDFTESNTLANAKCSGCNLKNASLRGADATSAAFAGSNFDKTCLVDANLAGADLTNANLSSAIFCRTTMPDGTVNDRDCGKATACCPTCIELGDACGNGVPGSCCDGVTCAANNTCCNASTCANLGKQCGSYSDACGGTVECGNCGTGATPACNNGTCATCPATCGASCEGCITVWDGTTRCGDTRGILCGSRCSTSADCSGFGNFNTCIIAFTQRSNNNTTPISSTCGAAAKPGACAWLTGC